MGVFDHPLIPEAFRDDCTGVTRVVISSTEAALVRASNLTSNINELNQRHSMPPREPETIVQEVAQMLMEGHRPVASAVEWFGGYESNESFAERIVATVREHEARRFMGQRRG